MLKGLVLAASVPEAWREMLTGEDLPWVQLQKEEREDFVRALEVLQARQIRSPLQTAAPLPLQAKEVLCLVETKQQERLARDLGMPCMGYLSPAHPGESLSRCAMLVEGLEEVDRIFLEEVHARANGLPVRIAETEHLVIREASLEDLDGLCALYKEQDPFLKPEFWGTREEELEKLRAYITSMYGFYQFGMWVVIEKTSGRLIGRVGFGIADYLERPDVELGYVIAKEFRRKGYGKEACSAAISYAWERLELPEVCAYIDRENAASIGLIESLGFRRERELFCENRILSRYCLCQPCV